MAQPIFEIKNHNFSDLESEYNDFLTPSLEILVDGTNIIQESVGIKSLRVESSIEPIADSFSFSVINAFDLMKRQFNWVDKYFVVGKTIEIKLGYLDKLKTVFYGYITSVSYEFSADSTPVLSVKGMDTAFLMMKGIHSDTWKKKKHSDVAKTIGGKYSLTVKADATTDQYEIINQHECSDFHFLLWMANENNFDFFIVGKEMHFRKPLADKTAVLTLEYGLSLLAVNLDVDISSQVSEVIVRGYDPKQLKETEGKSSTVNKLGGNKKTGKDIIQTLTGEAKEYIYANVISQAQAKSKADAELNKKAMELVTGSAECIGIPELRAGLYIKLDGLGPGLNEIYYMKTVTHILNESGYTTEFTIGGNAI